MFPTSIANLSRPLAAALFSATFLFSGASLAQSNGVKLDVPYVPTPESVVERMLEMAEVTSDDYVIDLGSGDGRIPIAAARLHGARAFGVDIDPRRVAEANENAEKAGVTDKVEFKEQNLFETPIGDANVLTMYLLSSVNLQVRPRILDEMRPGSRVVSHAFNMGDWEPDQSDTVEGRNIYFWIVPAKVEGRWEVTHGDTTFNVEIDQDFQKIQVKATRDGTDLKVSDANLRGDEISFTVDMDNGERRRFAGRVDGDTITAAEVSEALSGEGERVEDWRAQRAS